MKAEDLQKVSRSLFDEYVDTFKREEFPFTMFGKMAGKKGMLFDLSFAEECSMLVCLCESDEDTVQGYLFDVIPYRNLDDETKEKVLQIVNTDMNQESLLYDETIHRFVIPVELSRNEDKDIRFLFRKIGERILMCFMPPKSCIVEEGIKLSDGLRSVVESSSKPNKQVAAKVTQPLIDEFEMALREKGYILKKEVQNNGSAILVYMASHKGTREGVMMSATDDHSVVAYVTYPVDFSGVPNHFVDQIVKEMQERVNTNLGHVMYVAEIKSVNYLHHFYRNHFYPYEDLGAQLISLFEQEVELALDVFKETAKKYGL